MFNSMASPWAAPPPPGTQGQYAYQQSEFLRLTAPYSTVKSNNSLATPAYHAVQVRQTFNQLPHSYAPIVQPHAPPPPPPEASAPRKKIEWPQPVRNYVQRSFDPSNLIANIPRPEMELRLKQTISAATDSNSLHTIDWDNLPLPQEMIRQERAQNAAAWRQESVNMYVAGNNLASPMDVTSKKRKSQEMAGDEDSSLNSPWRITNSPNGFEDRVSFQPARDRFDKRQQPFQDDGAPKNSSKFQKALEKRQRRFDGGYKSSYNASPPPEPSDRKSVV